MIADETYLRIYALAKMMYDSPGLEATDEERDEFRSLVDVLAHDCVEYLHTQLGERVILYPDWLIELIARQNAIVSLRNLVASAIDTYDLAIRMSN